MHARTLLWTLALVALLPTAAAATPAPDADSEALVEWNCGPSSSPTYDECVLAATIVTAVCYYVTRDYNRCPQ